MRNRLVLIVGLLAMFACINRVQAAGPEADPNKEYWLSPSDGPYLIFVASYRGDDARKLANELVLKLRSHYKLTAYLWSKSEDERKAQEKWLAELHAKYGEDQKFGKYRIVDDFAVVVGHWKDMDSAKKELDQIKKAPPPANVPTYGHFIVQAQWNKRTQDLKGAKASAAIDRTPFSQAFVTPNPLATRDQNAAVKMAKPDPTWADLNAREKYSLFKNPKPWTLVVQVYQGTSITEPAAKPNVFDKANPGAREKSRERQLRILSKASGKNLETAGLDAAKLVELLRDNGRGFDAYVMHTSHASLVTVGGFKGPTDPELLRMQKMLAGKKFGEVELLPTPVAMEVPRK